MPPVSILRMRRREVLELSPERHASLNDRVGAALAAQRPGTRAAIHAVGMAIAPAGWARDVDLEEGPGWWVATVRLRWFAWLALGLVHMVTARRLRAMPNIAALGVKARWRVR